MPMRRCLLLMVVLAAATTAVAQSDTGRHRPAPTPVAVEISPAASGSPWHIGLSAGLASGGDLFRARAGGSVPWDPEGGAPFGSPEFVVTLDEGFTYGVTLAFDVRPWLRARADVAFARLPMTAEARVGETVRVYEYDELNAATYAFALEARLTRSPSHPFLAAGVGAMVASGVGSTAYDQSVLAGRLTAGYHQVLSPSLALRLEIHDQLQTLDFEDYRPPTSLPIYPSVAVENLGPQHVLGLTAGLQANF
jgi:hypothetical protein